MGHWPAYMLPNRRSRMSCPGGVLDGNPNIIGPRLQEFFLNHGTQRCRQNRTTDDNF